jgi:glycopeptide antibiotics resistance protein
VKQAEAIGQLCRLAFYVSVGLFFYGTLFPFEIDVSSAAWQHAWSRANLIPYWDLDRGRIHSLPDIVSNILLTMPLGFFGFLGVETAKTWPRLFKWGLYGLALGVTVEVMQLAMPSRVSNITDVLNNAVGALAGAVFARLLGPPILGFFARAREDSEQALVWLLFLVLCAVLLGPFDLTVDVGHVKADLKQLLMDPWEARKGISHEWVQTVEFALFGALAGRLVRRRLGPWGLPSCLGIAAVLALPFILELGQLFVKSHAPSLRDMAMGFVGVSLGFIASLGWPALMHPVIGLVLLTAAIIAAGLSPYRFVPWELRADFQWVPLVEYYTRTTMGAVYDAGIGIVNFGLWAAFFKASLPSKRWVAVVASLLLAGGIELAQLLVPERVAGTTDMMMAVLGGWAGSTIYGALASHAASAKWPSP